MSLDLDGVHPPRSARRSSIMLGFRANPATAAWVREQADAEQVTTAGWLQLLVERTQRGERLPADVRDWLARQAAQCGSPGDLDRALTEVVRHLAARWPDGARLEPVDGPTSAQQASRWERSYRRQLEVNKRLTAKLAALSGSVDREAASRELSA